MWQDDEDNNPYGSFDNQDSAGDPTTTSCTYFLTSRHHALGEMMADPQLQMPTSPPPLLHHSLLRTNRLNSSPDQATLVTRRRRSMAHIQTKNRAHLSPRKAAMMEEYNRSFMRTQT